MEQSFAPKKINWATGTAVCKAPRTAVSDLVRTARKFNQLEILSSMEEKLWGGLGKRGRGKSNIYSFPQERLQVKPVLKRAEQNLW